MRPIKPPGPGKSRPFGLASCFGYPGPHFSACWKAASCRTRQRELLDLKAASPALALDAKSEAREIDSTCEARSFRPSAEQVQDSPVEPERAFLLRAATYHEVVERDEIEVDKAFDALIDQFLHI